MPTAASIRVRPGHLLLEGGASIFSILGPTANYWPIDNVDTKADEAAISSIANARAGGLALAGSGGTRPTYEETDPSDGAPSIECAEQHLVTPSSFPDIGSSDFFLACVARYDAADAQGCFLSVGDTATARHASIESLSGAGRVRLATSAGTFNQSITLTGWDAIYYRRVGDTIYAKVNSGSEVSAAVSGTLETDAVAFGARRVSGGVTFALTGHLRAAVAFIGTTTETQGDDVIAYLTDKHL